jgi:hypothetical protein
MVDALSRAHRLLQRRGCVIDLHPTPEPAAIEVGSQAIGVVGTADGPGRHAAADAAVHAVVDEGMFVVRETTVFTFYTYGDSIEELREYVEENWRDARIDEQVVARTREALAAAPGVRPRVREDVRATLLHPRTRSAAR